MEKNETLDMITTTLIGKDPAKTDAFLFNFLGRLSFVVDDLNKRGLNLSPQEVVDMAKRSREMVGL